MRAHATRTRSGGSNSLAAGWWRPVAHYQQYQGMPRPCQSAARMGACDQSAGSQLTPALGVQRALMTSRGSRHLGSPIATRISRLSRSGIPRGYTDSGINRIKSDRSANRRVDLATSRGMMGTASGRYRIPTRTTGPYGGVPSGRSPDFRSLREGLSRSWTDRLSSVRSAESA